jgi:hypothetical protein
MIIKCTMREGITEADIEGFRYTFRPDEAGNPLCSVTKEGHIKQLMLMGPHCYVEFKPNLPYEQMSADEIMALPDGQAEDHKIRIRDERARADAIEAEQAEKKAQDPEARLKKLEEKAAAGTGEDPPTKQSAAANLAEERIRSIIQSFRTLSKKRFESWIDNNRDQIATMPEDVKAALAAKLIKHWPKSDPEIPGLNLEKYATSADDTDKGHSNNK